MGTLSIKLTIASRSYPLNIDRKDEETVRKAAKLIEKNLKEYEQNFSVRDKQDLLAMCALHFANQIVSEEGMLGAVDNNIAEKLVELDLHAGHLINE